MSRGKGASLALMHTRLRTLLMSLLLASLSSAQEAHELGRPLLEALEARTVPENQEDQEQVQAARVAGQLLAQLRMSIADGNFRQLENLLSQASTQFAAKSELVKLAADLRQEVREILKAERVQALEMARDELKALYERVSERSLSARVPEDLDALIRELGAKSISGHDTRGGESAVEQELAREIAKLQQLLTDARRFLPDWQNYLAAVKRDDLRSAKERLMHLARQDQTLIPRSQILDRISRIEGLMDPEAVVRAIEGPDELAEAIDRLSQLQKLVPDPEGNLRATISSLSELESAYRNNQRNVSFSLTSLGERSAAGYTLGADKIGELRAELLFRLLPRWAGVSDDPQPQPGETLVAFVRRLAAEAAERGEYALAFRIIEGGALVERNNRLFTSDHQGLRELAAARNQLDAGALQAAVISLHKALKSGSDLVPAKHVGELLDQIAAEDPGAARTNSIEALLRTEVSDDMLEKEMEARKSGTDPTMSRPSANEPVQPAEKESQDAATEGQPAENDAPPAGAPGGSPPGEDPDEAENP